MLFVLSFSNSDYAEKIADSSQGLIVGGGHLLLLNHRNWLFKWKLCNCFHYDLKTVLEVCSLDIASQSVYFIFLIHLVFLLMIGI